MRLLRYSLRLSASLTILSVGAGLVSGLAVSFVPLLIGRAVGGVVTAGSLRVGDLVALLAACAIQGLVRPWLAWLDSRLIGLTNRDQAVRLGSAGVSGPPVTQVEDPEFRSAVSFARSQFHFLDSGLHFVWIGLIPGVTALVTLTILAWIVHSPIAAGLLAGSVLFDAWWTGRIAVAESTSWGDVADEVSRAEYAGDVLLNPAAAKEVRAFSLGTFVRGMYRSSIGQVHSRFRQERWSRFRGGVGVSVLRMAVISGVAVWVTFEASARANPVGMLATALPVGIGFATVDLAPIRLLGQGAAALSLLEATSVLPPQSEREMA